MIIRVVSSIGISRISLPSDATFGDLNAEIRKRIQVPDGTELKFVHDDTNIEISGSARDTLVKLGVEHGSCLRLIPRRHGSSHAPDMSYVSVSAPTSAPADPTPSPTGSTPSAPRQETESEFTQVILHVDRAEAPDATSDPNFKSFDAFLRDNGYPLSDLALKLSYKPVVIERGKMNKLPPSVTVKHQPYRHVDHLELMNADDIQNFASYWMNDLEMAEQRAGWLYGYYVEDPHYPLGIRAVCEGIYEPPQKSALCDVELLPDDFLSVADLIAERLGLERIGHIITHLPRETYLSPQEVVDSAKIQLERAHSTHYTGYPVTTHVTCTLHPDSEGKPALNAFMVSDTAMALLRDGVVSDSQDDSLVLRIREAAQKNEILPQIIESGKEVTSFDPSWFVVRVNDSAPIKPNSIFRHTQFPRENRGGPSVTIDDVKGFLSTRLASGVEATDPALFSDFHLILFLGKILDIHTTLAICDAVVGAAALDPIMVELLIDH
ncbi:nuclear protein localization protein 4, putative [Babesia caballi]|uniref:Nuclear protein localization protein 4, putative n=1 Tax=Babesia caballi TaxID=5871 RepID=A0AAV4LYZ6_BABCB|nr:nuclear protein localization protein 4, putative [Babesia caballi]